MLGRLDQFLRGIAAELHRQGLLDLGADRRILEGLITRPVSLREFLDVGRAFLRRDHVSVGEGAAGVARVGPGADLEPSSGYFDFLLAHLKVRRLGLFDFDDDGRVRTAGQEALYL